MKTSRHQLRFPVFSNYPVRVVFCDDIIKEAKRLKLALPSGEAQDEEAYTAIAQGGCMCVFGNDPDAQTIAHEAYHAIVALLKFSGANSEEELVAYHLGYLVSRITKWKEKHIAQTIRGDSRQGNSQGSQQEGSSSHGSKDLQQQG
jgi:hypothetical protein